MPEPRQDRNQCPFLWKFEDERLGLSALGGLSTLAIVLGALGAQWMVESSTLSLSLAGFAVLISGFAWGGGAGGATVVLACIITAVATTTHSLSDRLAVGAEVGLLTALAFLAGQARAALQAAHVFRGLMLRETEAEIHALENEAQAATRRAEALARRLDAERRMTTAIQELSAEGNRVPIASDAATPSDGATSPPDTAEAVAIRIVRVIRDALGRGAVALVREKTSPDGLPRTLAAIGGTRGEPSPDIEILAPYVANILANNRPHLQRDATDDACAPGCSSGKIGSCIAVILKAGLVGRAILIATSPVRAAFGVEDLRLLDHFAVPAGLLLANADYLIETRRLATEDGLTGLMSRGAFDEVLASEIPRGFRYGHPFALLMLDLDRFKTLNDQHGHAAGDEALRRTATVFREILPPSARAGRIGGEEFAMLLPDTGPNQARELAERLRVRLSETVRRPDGAPLTASIGLAIVRPPSADSAASRSLQAPTAAQLLKSADDALYRAKSSGRDRVEVSE